MTYLVVGASSGLGRALAERFASSGNELILVSRDKRDTEALSAHLTILHGVKVSPVTIDLAKSPLSYTEIDAALQVHQPLKGVLLPAGANDNDDVVGLSDDKLTYLTRVNYLAPCELLNHYLPLLKNNDGVVIGFGSVATARGRTQNAAYAAAKSALQAYFESLAHSSTHSGMHCQFYILGYLNTNLAFAQDLPFPMAAPDRIANVVYKQRFTNGRRFLPRPWYMVYRIVQMLPWFIYKRLSF